MSKIAEDIADLFTRAASNAFRFEASGTPYYHAVKVINGHRVDAYIVLGTDNEQRFLEVDDSGTRRLTPREAEEALA